MKRPPGRSVWAAATRPGLARVESFDRLGEALQRTLTPRSCITLTFLHQKNAWKNEPKFGSPGFLALGCGFVARNAAPCLLCPASTPFLVSFSESFFSLDPEPKVDARGSGRRGFVGDRQQGTKAEVEAARRLAQRCFHVLGRFS